MKLNNFTKLSINLMQNKKAHEEEGKTYGLPKWDGKGCKTCFEWQQRMKLFGASHSKSKWAKGTPEHNQELADHARKITGRGLEKWQMM